MKKFLFVMFFIVCKTMAVFTDNVHSYFWANFQQFKKDKTEQAEQIYQELRDDTKSPVYINKGYIIFLRDTNQLEKIAPLIAQLDDAFKDDEEIQLIFAQAEAKVGLNNKAEERVIELSQKFNQSQEIIFHASQIYLGRKEPENAITIIDNLLNSSPRKMNNFIFHFMKAQIYIQMSEPKKALQEVNQSLELYPQFDKGWLMYAILQEQAGQLEQAIKGYTSFLEMSPISHKKIEQHVLELSLAQKMAPSKDNTLFVNKPCFDRALALVERKQFQQALQEVDRCIQQKPDEKTLLLKVQILSSLHDFNGAITLLQNQMSKEPNNDLWFKTVHLLCSLGMPYMNAIKALEKIYEKDTNNILPVLYLADLYMRVENKKNALNFLQKAVTLTNDKSLKTKILFQIATIYFDRQDIKSMKQVLLKGERLGVKFPPLLNLLAYYYTMYEQDLVRAQKLMNQALKDNKRNPHFLDTQALIYYKKKSYEKAQRLLAKIARVVPHDFLILNHLAKTCQKLGNTSKACTIMKKATLVAPTEIQKKKAFKYIQKWNKQFHEKTA